MYDQPSLAAAPPDLTRQERRRAFADSWLVDHGFIRDIYCNRHQVSDRVWRSAQPGPHHLRRAKQELGIRTVLNLRGRRDDCGSYIRERAAAHELGLTLVDFPIRSRGALEKGTLHAAAELFGRLEYPVLMHCKSGADRAGLMATLYLFLHEGLPLEQAMRQISLRYGHIRQGPTGVIDHFFETYQRDNAANPMPFLDWVDQVYEPQALLASFKQSQWGKLLVDRVLRRE